jgi:glycosyltransferase involved in cell wall biosynthesis
VTAVHAVLPAGIDDPARPSGGNVYDRRVLAGLAEQGWCVHEHVELPDLPDGALLLVDGLVADAGLVEVAARLRVVVLVHMPLGPDVPEERAVLEAAAGVVTTSRWTRRRLLEWYSLDPARVHVAEPGVDPADLAAGTSSGSSLLTVGAVTSLKGYDVLVAALGLVGDLSWSCRGVGSLTVDPTFVAGLGEGVELTGPVTRAELDATYAGADLLVLASRAETYGMVVTEALARGLPVITADVGGVREALGHTLGHTLGHEAGVLVPPGDAVALAGALRRWLTDPGHRGRLRAAARARRDGLGDWRRTTALVAGALAEVAS